MNTVVSGFMEHTNTLINKAKELGGLDKETMETLIILLAPFVPHIAEELWESIGHTNTGFSQSWPEYDTSMLKEETVTIVTQVNGKHRGSITLQHDVDEETVVTEAMRGLDGKLSGSRITEHIYVSGKVINFLTK
jgi:leucyl-tRNA synthetase